MRRTYGRPATPSLRPHGSPGDIVAGLVRTILSQNTTGSNADAAWQRLKARFPSWPDVAAAQTRSIEAAIRPAGLSVQRSRVIRNAVRKLGEDDPTLRLDFLREMATPDVLAYLQALPGVGPKTAACVALFEMDRTVFPVDTHILRIAGRLSWVAPGGDGRTRAGVP